MMYLIKDSKCQAGVVADAAAVDHRPSERGGRGRLAVRRLQDEGGRGRLSLAPPDGLRHRVAELHVGCPPELLGNVLRNHPDGQLCRPGVRSVEVADGLEVDGSLVFSQPTCARLK